MPEFKLDDDPPAPNLTDSDNVPGFTLDDAPVVEEDESVEIEFSLDEDEPDAVPRYVADSRQREAKPAADDDWDDFLKGFDK